MLLPQRVQVESESEIMDYTVTAVDRSLQVLEVVAENPGITIKDIASLTGNTRSLVFRILFTLEQRGYVIKDPIQRSYVAGYRPIFLGAQARDQIDVLRIASPYIDDIAGKCNDKINLAVRDGTRSLCIHSVRGKEWLHDRIGRYSVLYAGGAPKVLLAYAPLEVRQAVLAAGMNKFTPNTIDTPERLDKVLSCVREKGLVQSYGETYIDEFSFAGPILERGGEVIAALSIAGSNPGSDKIDTPFYAGLVKDTCRQISEAMGWRERVNHVT